MAPDTSRPLPGTLSQHSPRRGADWEGATISLKIRKRSNVLYVLHLYGITNRRHCRIDGLTGQPGSIRSVGARERYKFMCPRCHSTEVSRSRTRKIQDGFMRWMGMWAYRCRECNKRFYLPGKIDNKIRRDRAWRESVDKVQERSATPPEGTSPTIDPAA
jgi:hypothetical protein